MAVASIDIPAWLFAVSALFGLVGTISASVAVSRQVAIKASLESIIVANGELRADNEHLRVRLDEAARASAIMEGKLEAYTSHFAEQIVQAVIETVRHSSALVVTAETTVSP